MVFQIRPAESYDLHAGTHKTQIAREEALHHQDMCLKGIDRAASHLMASPPSSMAKSDFSASEDDFNQDGLAQTGHASMSGLQLEELIGRGAFGSVYRAVWRGMQVAVKVQDSYLKELPL